MSLPSWVTPLPDAPQMRETDRWAIEDLGIPSLDLMERAGEGLARTIAQTRDDGRIAIVCGPGNNGGDGFVAARLLRAAGREVTVLIVGEADRYQGDAKANLDRLDETPEPFDATALEGATVAVDALLGTGVQGAPRPPAAAAIAALNALDAPVVAADVPSGVDASTGEVAGEAVRAVATATFAAAKPGLWIHPGKAYAGRVEVIDIGIPAGAPVVPDVGIADESLIRRLPRRGADSTKFSSGHVLVLGGSRGLTGAACLAAMAAARAGAGYVTALVPVGLEDIFEIKLTEVMTRGLPETDGGLSAAATAGALRAIAEREGAVVVGPGIGRTDGALACARAVATQAAAPLLLDADGLNAMAGALAELAERSAPTILTPHAGELARLLEVSSAEVTARRLHHARAAARAANAIVVLKGDDTLVCAPDGTTVINPISAPMLATAGTGDVLSGTIGALLASGVDPFEAAAAGVRLHALAGRLAGAERGADAVIASDVVDALGRARDLAAG
ncbi:MAG: NAD(P)H-hydrate dehydratase [Solirubrobacteraceae bacterium]|nr:NAD(P)H-hydrate dehydratase [Solirubrobacteraceae bacterium]